MLNAWLTLILTFVLPFLTITASLIIFVINWRTKNPRLKMIAFSLLSIPLIIFIGSMMPNSYNGVLAGGFASILFYVLPLGAIVVGIFCLVYSLIKKWYKLLWLSLGLFAFAFIILLYFSLLLESM